MSEKLRERIKAEYGLVDDLLDPIMDDVLLWHEADARQRERAAFEVAARIYADDDSPDSQSRYPMPQRTREVLREEPVPGTEWPKFRWMGGQLEVRHSISEWISCSVAASDHTLMRHALDLHDRPTRTETVPVDPDDPWGEG
jgi:hypothetical protein